MLKNNNFFKALNCINNKTKPDFDISKISGYMLSLWLAQDKHLIKYVNNINKYIFEIDNEVAFWYYYNVIPKSNRFIKYTKKRKNKHQEKLDVLCRKYNISEKEAKLSIEE